MVERGSTEHYRPHLGIDAVKRPIWAIEVHRHTTLASILDVRSIDDGRDLVAADRERESAV
jgi:hypothetical protein